jgi:hypothetical protein
MVTTGGIAHLPLNPVERIHRHVVDPAELVVEIARHVAQLHAAYQRRDLVVPAGLKREPQPTSMSCAPTMALSSRFEPVWTATPSSQILHNSETAPMTDGRDYEPNSPYILQSADERPVP